MRKKKNVPLATEKKAENENDPVVVSQQPQNASVDDSLFNLDQIPKKQLETAEALGIPLTAIFTRMNLWSASVEARIQLLAENISQNPQKTIELLKQEAVKARETFNSQQTQPTPTQAEAGQGDLSQLAGLAKVLGVGGSQEDPFSAAIKEGMIKNAVESMNSDAQMGRAIKEHVISSLAQKVAKSITETVVL